MRRVGQGESGGNETGKEVILRVKKSFSLPCEAVREAMEVENW